MFYALTLRNTVVRYPRRFRSPIGFLLCDELFALSSACDARHPLTPGYLIGAGLTFYLYGALAAVVIAALVRHTVLSVVLILLVFYAISALL